MLKTHVKGDDHHEATAQLRKVTGDGLALATALGDLLFLKTKAGYGAKPLPANDVKRASRAVEKLIAAATTRR